MPPGFIRITKSGKGKRPYLSTFVLWSIAVMLHAIYHVTCALSHPGPDLYANHIGFQLMVFSAFYLPFWVILLFVIFGVRTNRGGP